MGRRKPVRYYSPKRRAVYAKGDPIDSLVLFDLFGWTCYLCNNPIDPRKRHPDWRAATVEHITPLAHGGTHTWDNVAPAHYACNLKKGASDLPVPSDAGRLSKPISGAPRPLDN